MPGGQRAHFGDLIGDFLAHQVTAKADLTALPDEEFAAIGQNKVVAG